jgi:hypothetical protein
MRLASDRVHVGPLYLDGGVVRLDPLDFDVAGGRISSVIRSTRAIGS